MPSQAFIGQQANGVLRHPGIYLALCPNQQQFPYLRVIKRPLGGFRDQAIEAYFYLFGIWFTDNAADVGDRSRSRDRCGQLSRWPVGAQCPLIAGHSTNMRAA